jgi:NTE family protein
MSPPRTALVLAGGNALGAYGAGAYEAMHARGIMPDVISGGSIGAINGAIIAGNEPEHRVSKLREFWQQASLGTANAWTPASGKRRELYNQAQLLQTMMFGRPGLFGRRVPGAMSALPGMPPDLAIFDHRPSSATLERVIDFDLLNSAAVPLIVSTVDMHTGEAVRFDTRVEPLQPVHFLASSGLAPAFPPIAINGRCLGDPALVGNLPLDPVLDGVLTEDLSCFAVDLFAPSGEALRGLDSVVERAQDILFAAQSQRTLAAHMREHRLRHVIGALARSTSSTKTGDDASSHEDFAREGTSAQLTIVYIAYRGLPHELAGKSLEFSRASIDERWRAGREDMERALDKVANGKATSSARGCTFYDASRDSPER